MRPGWVHATSGSAPAADGRFAVTAEACSGAMERSGVPPGSAASSPPVPSPSMMRDLLRPKTLISHVLVLTVVVTCVVLGQWQLDQLADIRERNARSEARLAQPAADLAALADPASTTTVDEAALEYRRVEVTGTYRTDEEVLQRNHSHQNQTGFHVLTPLELTDGGVVLVRRGWVPSALSEPPVAEAAPETGEVTVEGVLERPVSQPGFGPTDPDDGVLLRVFHADTARLDRQVAGTLFPMVLRIDAQPEGAATLDNLPVPPGPPTLDERNHLSYAVQWHAFALIALITYGAWLRTRAKRLAGENVPGRDGPDDDGGPGRGGGGGLRGDPHPDRPLTGAPR
jgi:surfeit locus 1 family protein